MPPELFAYTSPTLRSRAVSAGDRLILGKPLGCGIYSRAQAAGVLSGQDEMLLAAQAARSNAEAAAMLDCLFGAHAQVEVGAQGFVAALRQLLALAPLESGPLAAEVEVRRLPVLPAALSLASRFGESVVEEASLALEFAAGVATAELQAVLLAAQAHGGLLVACAPERLTEVLACFLQAGFAQAVAIGHVHAGETRLTLR